jgi:SAM-dependent methyltransferase
MDQQTLALYNQHAADLCARYRRAAPGGLYDLIRAWFHADAVTADIGCGSGRDVAWLTDHGFAAVGYDASPAMLAEARAAYPIIDVRTGALPDLATIPNDAYANILCTATLMHVPRTDIITAVLNLARILRLAGRMILAYRGSTSTAEREPDGRLYTSLPTGKLTLLLESAGLHALHTTTLPDATRPAITWHTLVVERSPLDVARGLERIQAVLAQDRKVATYKFALIRALCTISRTQAHLAQWHAGRGRRRAVLPSYRHGRDAALATA